MDASVISALAALAGTAVGGLTSVVANWLSHRIQVHAQSNRTSPSRFSRYDAASMCVSFSGICNARCTSVLGRRSAQARSVAGREIASANATPTMATAIPVLVVTASPCRFSKSRGDSLTSDNALQVARAGGQVADLADFLESVSSAARFFGIFSSDSSPLVCANDMIAGVISRSKVAKEG